ncbi:fibronectin type III domain-containing protein [Luteolibacter flavescens]|uniref:Fibronectin type III domain-containing protein n=1 Tax=Luteolibacter flavescens TaxID=1859460 RepID=A0ABT3FQT8_9BACT|nr:fibronectin type III domain-containing protein [Luteolibacter flavescens]MCW1885939.1 fibronectin type III domain-containing protein [Luteolibacter flavescens]
MSHLETRNLAISPWRLFAGGLLFLGATPMAASAAITPSSSVSLEWSPNPEPDVVGYKVHFGTDSGSYSAVIDVKGATRVELPPVSLGTPYFLAVSAYNAAGDEGPLSAELTVKAEVPLPVADTSVSVGSPGQAELQWRYPRADNAPAAEKFTIYTSEDLRTWSATGDVLASEPARMDADWLYFEFPHAVDRPRMFFKVGSSNAFGEQR